MLSVTASGGGAAVVVRDLRKSYGSFEAVRGVSFDIEHGETFALLGPNGAGKSTTIEILEGYRDRSGGDVTVLGIDPHRGGSAWKARLGIVLQSGSEAADVTVREQVAHFARFTLMFVYALREAFRGIRAFTFVDDVHEVTELLRPEADPAEVIAGLAGSTREAVLAGRTHYGRVFESFAAEAGWRLGR